MEIDLDLTTLQVNDRSFQDHALRKDPVGLVHEEFRMDD